MHYFDHEKLDVYQESLRFTAWAESLIEGVSKPVAACGQLDRASTSVPLNIAEGNGKFQPADRCRFFDIARGSALESAAALDVLVAKRRLQAQDIVQGKEMLRRIVSMLVGLIRSTSPDRVFEAGANYGAPATAP